MAKRIPLELEVANTVVTFTVATAAGDANGVDISSTTPTRSVTIRNAGGRSFEYQVNDGAWVPLGAFQSALLDLDMSVDVIATRKSLEGGSSDPAGVLELEAATGTVKVEEDTVGGVRRVTGTAEVKIKVTDETVIVLNTTGPATKRLVTLPAQRVNGRKYTVVIDGGDQGVTAGGNGKSIVPAVNTGGSAITEVATAKVHTFTYSADLDKWVTFSN